MTLKHRHEVLAVGRVAGLNDDIKDEAAASRHRVECVPELNLAHTLDDDVGVRLDQAHTFVARPCHLVSAAAAGLPRVLARRSDEPCWPGAAPDTLVTRRTSQPAKETHH